MEENIVRQSFEYYAFISYSRKDEAWAKWLQKELEQYRLPTILRKEQQSLPGKIRPIFRDKTDLTTGQLQTALHKELDSSKKLIVLCSPASAKSEWVNKEVQRFIDDGRIEDIIPLIVDGVPNSGGEDECFMPALKLPEEEQILGVSIPELGKKDALLRVIAGLLDIKFDQLKRRHEQRRKRQNIMRTAVACACAVVGSIVGYTAWDYYVPHEALYNDYVLKWGVPEGIVELTKEQAAGMEGHYRITTQKGLVRELVYLNSAGKPMEHLESELRDRPMISLFYYRDDGRIEYVEYTEINDRVLATQVYTTDMKYADFQVSGENSALQTLAGSSTSSEGGMFDLNISAFEADRSDIARYMLEYDENGYVTTQVYYRDRRTPILDADGIGGLEYTNDELGRPVEIRYLGLGGAGYASTKQNIAGKRYFYDDRGNRVRIEYFNPEGELSANESGWMVCEYEFDEAGNNVGYSYLDAAGELRLSSLGYAYTIMGYDERGNYISIEYFDEDGERATRRGGVSIIKKEYDENGWIVRQAYFNQDEEPYFFEDETIEGYSYGSALELYEYDERGNMKSLSSFGTDYEPLNSSRGYASFTIECDERGNRIHEEYFGEDGEPILMIDGVASFDAEYDERNNLIKRTYYGTDGELINSNFGFAIRENEYDDRNNNVRADYFGTDGKPILSDLGFASVVYVYNDGGNISEHHYYGVNGEPVLNTKGYSSLKADFDESGNGTRMELYGVNGEPVLCDDGYHIIACEYDERGNTNQMLFFGIDGELTLINSIFSGIAGMRAEYDEHDNMIKTTNLGLDGKPVLNTEGSAITEMTYDVRGDGTGIYFFGVDGEPVETVNGYQAIVMEFDEKGNMTDIYILDGHGDKINKQGFRIGDIEGDDEAAALELRTGDIFVQYGDWIYGEYDPEDMSELFDSFLEGVGDAWDTEKTVVFYRPSEDLLIEREFGPEYMIEIELVWVGETNYKNMLKAYDLLLLSPDTETQ